jgi:protection of telomeres protein 1
LPVTTIGSIVNLDRTFKGKNGILELPFINRRVRAHVRVVDFYPPDLEDFCHWYEGEQSKDDEEDEEEDDEEDSGRWQWEFCLLVEDASTPTTDTKQPRLRLFFDGRAGDQLLQLTATE